VPPVSKLAFTLTQAIWPRHAIGQLSVDVAADAGSPMSRTPPTTPDRVAIHRPSPSPSSGTAADSASLPPVSTPSWLTDTKASYNTVAASYAEMFHDGLARHPYVRGALALFAELLRDVGGPVLDVGCGIGLLTGPLRDLGFEAFGIDVSPGMLAIARRATPTCGSTSAP